MGRRIFHIPFPLYLLGSSALILLVQVMAYLHIVDMTIGAFPLMRRMNWMGREDLPTRIVVLRSAFSAVRSGDHPEYYYDLAAYWEHQMTAESIPFAPIKDEDLAKGLGNTASVLILPWTVCMSDAQRTAVRDFVAAGHGLIATGPFGVRNEDCSWFGWEFMAEMTGMDGLDSTTPEEPTFASFRAKRFFSQSMPPGLRMDLPKHELAYGIHPDPDIYWSDGKWGGVDKAAPGEVALGIHTQTGPGRVVWAGFNERITGSKSGLGRFMDQYTRSAVRWASRQPLIGVAPWPKDMEMAAMIAASTGKDREASKSLAKLFVEAGVPGTVFSAEGGAPPVERTDGRVEVAAAGDDDKPLADNNVLNQVQELNSLRKALENSQGVPVAGFKPPQDMWNIDTLVALRSSGYKYFLDRTGNSRAVPEIVEFPSGAWLGGKVEVAKISTAWSDDFDVVSKYKGPTPWKADLGDEFLEELERCRYVGGAYVFSFSSRLLGAGENLPVVRSVLERVKGSGAWLASGSELTSWWSKREKVRVETRQITQHRIKVSVVNRGRTPVEDLSVYVHLPYKPKWIRMISEIIGKLPPKHEMPEHEDLLRLDFPKLAKESSYVFIVALTEI